MSGSDGVESPFSRTDVATVAARQCVMRTGEPVTLRIYEVTETSKVLKRRFRVLKRLDGSIGIATT